MAYTHVIKLIRQIVVRRSESGWKTRADYHSQTGKSVTQNIRLNLIKERNMEIFDFFKKNNPSAYSKDLE